MVNRLPVRDSVWTLVDITNLNCANEAEIGLL
jgi:hypothetical protein